MTQDLDGAPPARAVPEMFRRGLALAAPAATAVAAGRVALGLAALARPSVPARPWIGASADDLATSVFGRALGARDLALGLGALAALRQSPAAAVSGPARGGPARGGSARAGLSGSGPAPAWVAAGALSDALDVGVTVAAWSGLPRRTRWVVAACAGGAALAGAAGAIAMLSGRR